MPVAPSFADLLAQGQAEAQERRPDLLFREGDVTVADLHAASAMADAVLRFAAQAFKATFIDGAEGAELTTLVNDHLNLQRFLASAAQVFVTFTRTSGGAGGTIPLGSVVGTDFDAGGKQVLYQTTVDVVVGGGENGPWTILCTALEPGRGGNAEAGKVVRINTPLWDTFSVTNEAAATGGNEAETDEELRERARAYWITLRRGTMGALEYGAKLVPTVRIARAKEDGISGVVSVLVSDSDGGSTLQMINDVLEELENWRAAGVLVNVYGATPILVSMSLGLVVRTGFNVPAVVPTLHAAVDGRIYKLKPDEALYQDMIVAAVIGQFPDDILDVRFLSVTANGAVVTITTDPIVPGWGQVIRPGSFTFAKVAP
jgi:hypothetical protein